MHIILLSTFPEYFASPLQTSIVGRAISNKQVEIFPFSLGILQQIVTELLMTAHMEEERGW